MRSYCISSIGVYTADSIGFITITINTFIYSYTTVSTCSYGCYCIVIIVGNIRFQLTKINRIIVSSTSSYIMNLFPTYTNIGFREYHILVIFSIIMNNNTTTIHDNTAYINTICTNGTICSIKPNRGSRVLCIVLEFNHIIQRNGNFLIRSITVKYNITPCFVYQFFIIRYADFLIANYLRFPTAHSS